MSTPKQPRRGPAGLVVDSKALLVGIKHASGVWTPLEGVPGYWVCGGRICREIKVRTNKNGTQWARVSIRGKQHVVRV